MECLVFAHRGEAQAFLDYFQFKPVEGHDQLYTDQERLLFITGEGVFETLSKVSSILSSFPSISLITNLGVTGSLNSDLQELEVYSVRSVYANFNGKFKFKSFTSSDKSAKIDLVTLDYRLSHNEKADQISAYGDLVDRELWSIAFATSSHKITWRSFKCISDFADNTYSCQSIKEKAIDYSKRLFNFYVDNSVSTSSSTHNIEIDDIFENHLKEFYFTFTQRKKALSLIKKISLNRQTSMKEVLESFDLTTMIEQQKNAKKRTSILIQKLEEITYPFKTKTIKQANEYLDQFRTDMINLSFDSNLEDQSLEIKLRLKDENDRAILMEKLKDLNFQKFKSLIQGES